MKYKVTLNGRTYEVEVEKGQAMLTDEYEAYAPAPAAVPAAAPAAPASLLCRPPDLRLPLPRQPPAPPRSPPPAPRAS